MRRFARWIVLCPTALCASVLHAESLNFLMTDISGLSSAPQQAADINGALVKVAKSIAKRAGVDARIVVIPWARALLQTEKDAGSCAVGPRKTGENAEKFSWIGPIGRQRYALYALADNALPLREPGQIAGKHVGMLRGAYIKSESEARGYVIDEGSDIETNVRKLQAHRVDYLLVGEIEMNAHLAAQATPLPIKPVYFFSYNEHYIACNPALAKETQQKLNAAVRSLASEGGLQKFGIAAR